MDGRELLRKAHAGDRDAAEQFLRENSALIWSIVRRYLGRGTEADDLYQLGCLGFIKAVEGFDESYGTAFSTYAVPKIAGEIRRFLRDDGPVKVSRTLKERAALLATEREKLQRTLNREPLLSELASVTGLSATEIAEAECAANAVESYQQEYGDSELSLENILADNAQEERTLTAVTLKSAMEELPDKQRKVIALRYFHGLTQQSCASILSVSQVQVSRLEKKALQTMRELLREWP